MIIWYLLFITGQPLKVYPQVQEQQACADYNAAGGSPHATILQLSGRKDSPTVAKADCLPVQQVVVTK